MKRFPSWTKNLLKAAGIYNIIWGSWVVLFPISFFHWFNLPSPIYPMIWQSVGMIVGVYGIGYYIAAYNPQRYWPLIFVGWLGKLFGPIGAFYYLMAGKLTPWFLLHNLTNDLIWLPFFTVILYFVARNAQVNMSTQNLTLKEALTTSKTNKNHTLSELNHKMPVMLIFLRHFGCTFCRETLAEVSNSYGEISKNCKIVLVHMSTTKQADQYFHSLGLAEAEHLSDPECTIYNAFDLPRGNFLQLFGPKVWWRGFHAGIIKRHGIGKLQGDGFQMPGIFLLFQNKVLYSYYYSHAGEQPNLEAISKKGNVPVFLN
jgi:peroxiredoxin